MAGKKTTPDKGGPAQSKNKPARRDLPQTDAKAAPKKWWKTALNVAGLLAWTWVSVFVSQLVVGNIMYAILGQALAEPVWEAVFSAIAYLLALGLAIWVPPKVSVGWKIINEKKDGKKVTRGEAAPKAMGREGLGLKDWPTWTDIGLSVVGFIVYLLIAAGVTALFSMFSWFDAEQVQEVGFSLGMSGPERILAFITLVVVAPVAEEIIFRGWLYGKIRTQFLKKMPDWAGVTLAILLVSVLFGIVHGQWNVGVNVFALSVVLCGLREITGTIYAGILLHMLKNGVAFYMLYVLGMG